MPEAQEMVQSMLAAQPAKRPTMQGIMEQPFWWSPARRLAFLIHLSDRVETEDREVCNLLNLLSRHFKLALTFLLFDVLLQAMLFLKHSHDVFKSCDACMSYCI